MRYKKCFIIPIIYYANIGSGCDIHCSFSYTWTWIGTRLFLKGQCLFIYRLFSVLFVFSTENIKLFPNNVDLDICYLFTFPIHIIVANNRTKTYIPATTIPSRTNPIPMYSEKKTKKQQVR
jgi:hypothetical protein